MAQRVIEVDGNKRVYDSGSTIGDVLERTGKGDAPSVVADGKVITPRDYHRPAPLWGMVTNASAIEKGAPLRDCLLNQECDLIADRFLGRFPGARRTLELNENTLVIRSFPLPDSYSPDRVDLLIVIWGYYDLCPAGVHVPAKSENLGQIAQHLGGHVMENIPSGYRHYVEELEEHGWRWICHHFKNWSWKLNPNNLLTGDCLFKYVENVYAALSGGHR